MLKFESIMRLKEILSLALLFFGCVTPLLYSTGLFYNAGWEAYWGIPQGLFELGFHMVVVTGFYYIIDVIMRLFPFAIIILSILFILLFFYYLIAFPVYKLINYFFKKITLFLNRLAIFRQFRGRLKREYVCRIVLGNNNNFAYNPYKKSSVYNTRWGKKIVIVLLLVFIIGITFLAFVMMDAINAGCRKAEDRGFGIKNDRNWVNNSSIEFESYKESKFIPLKCGKIYCAVVDTKTLQVHILKVSDIGRVSTPRSVFEIRNFSLSRDSSSLCKHSLIDMVNQITNKTQ